MIEKMERPKNWKQGWFRDAQRGNYLLMWRWKKEKGYTLNRNPLASWQNRQIRRFHDYVKEPEGIIWHKTRKPSW